MIFGRTFQYSKQKQIWQKKTVESVWNVQGDFLIGIRIVLDFIIQKKLFINRKNFLDLAAALFRKRVSSEIQHGQILAIFGGQR